VRHAITKLANIHFPATRKSGERIEKMGENVWRIFVVGAPRLDSVFKEKLLSKKEVVEKYNLDLSRPVLLVLQHPVSLEVKEAGKQMKETMEAIKELGFQAIISYPGADSGGRRIINVIEKYRKYPFVKIYKNILHKDYLSLMKVSDVIVGNSSSGIVEAPFFRLAAVNIGTRQGGREKTENVLDVDYKKNQIKRAIQKALSDRKFRQRVKKSKNPYGSGIAAKKITYILAKIKIDKRLLQKQINY
jgi:GDP/UDP-N,N'-diacetylbacillosamine 2-epimerase (hydrolysing)